MKHVFFVYFLLKPINFMALQYYGGQGFEAFYEDGFYSVISNVFKLEFRKLSEAKEIYDSINDEKAIWCDKTHTLIDCYYNSDELDSDFMDNLPF